MKPIKAEQVAAHSRQRRRSPGGPQSLFRQRSVGQTRTRSAGNGTGATDRKNTTARTTAIRNTDGELTAGVGPFDCVYLARRGDSRWPPTKYRAEAIAVPYQTSRIHASTKR